jgi:hypothetical protein
MGSLQDHPPMSTPPSPSTPPATLGADGCWHIDVRGLPPPQPLVAILRQVDRHGHDGRALVVHHDRDPALLYPELAERGWWADRIDGDPGEVRLRLQRA